MTGEPEPDDPTAWTEDRPKSVSDAPDLEHSAHALARALSLPDVSWHAELPSTMDEAHRLAALGAPGGTLVVAERQTRGRGRGGKEWASAERAGVWMTLIERPSDASGLDVLSLRVGLQVAVVLDRVAGELVRLKWPNDLMLSTGKVGGILVEVRWREQRPEWAAIGIGINVHAPGVPGGAWLRADGEPHDGDGDGPSRHELLAVLVPAVRAAAAAHGGLGSHELQEFARRDWARGRRVSAPERGTVVGISPTGAVLIETSRGQVACASGSLVLDVRETP